MPSDLSIAEIRVLGALMEKAVTTPEYYPLTVNSLVAACNQRSSRLPVTDYDEEEVRSVLDSLRDRGLVMRVDVSGARTAKFRHHVTSRWELDDPSHAILTVLFLRGPQTVGQLRARSERLYSFRDIAEVQDTLEGMQRREVEPEVLVRPLPLQPGIKEVRFIHTLGTEESILSEVEDTSEENGRATIRLDGTDEVAALRTEIDALRETVNLLQQDLEAFKAQF